MSREEAIENLKILKENYWDDDGYGNETEQYNDTMTALDMAIKALEHEPREITLEDVKEYCKPRCLTIITDELLYELTHTKIKARKKARDIK